MKRLLAGFFILFLTACGSSASTSPTADLPALLPPTPTQGSASTEEVIEPELPVDATSVIAQPTDEPVILATPVCIDAAPTQADIDRALSLPGGIFDGGDWERTYTVASDKVVVSWYNASIPTIVNLEALIFPCSYEDPDLDVYFNDEGWAIIFGNYQGYTYVNECSADGGLRLYNFVAVDQGVAYNVQYWVLSDTPTRVISFMSVMPQGANAQTEEIAYALFPQLQSCP